MFGSDIRSVDVRVRIWEDGESRETDADSGRPVVRPEAPDGCTAILRTMVGNVVGGRNILGILRNRPESGETGNGNGPNRIGCGPGRMETARQGWRAVGTVRVVGGGLGRFDSDAHGSTVPVLQRLNVGADFNSRNANGSAQRSGAPSDAGVVHRWLHSRASASDASV